MHLLSSHLLPSCFKRPILLWAALLCMWVLEPLPELRAQTPAEEAVMVLDTSMLIPWLGTRNFVTYFPKKGTVIFEVEAEDKPLLQVEIRKVLGPQKGDSKFLYSSTMVESFSDSVDNDAHDRIRFNFRNGSLTFRYVHIILYHLKARPEAPRVYQDTIIETVFGAPVEVDAYKVLPVYRDSLSLGTVTIDSLRMALFPAGDKDKGDRDTLGIVIPAEYENQVVVGWAYWVGIGPGSWIHFEQYGQQLPQEWREAGVIDPLHAYARGLIGKIPAVNMGNRANIAIVSPATSGAFMRGESLDSLFQAEIVTYGRFWKKQQDPQKWILCLENPYPGSALSAYVKVVLMYEKLSVREIANRQRRAKGLD